MVQESITEPSVLTVAIRAKTENRMSSMCPCYSVLTASCSFNKAMLLSNKDLPG